MVCEEKSYVVEGERNSFEGWLGESEVLVGVPREKLRFLEERDNINLNVCEETLDKGKRFLFIYFIFFLHSLSRLEGCRRHRW